MRIVPIVIPRASCPSPGKLYFSVVFTFSADEVVSTAKVSLPAWVDALPAGIRGTEFTSGVVPDKGSTGMILHIDVGCSGQIAPLAARLAPPFRKRYDPVQARGAWQAIFNELALSKPKVEGDPATRCPLAARYSASGANTKVDVNPSTASDLRPGWRLECPRTESLQSALAGSRSMAKLLRGADDTVRAAREFLRLNRPRVERELLRQRARRALGLDDPRAPGQAPVHATIASILLRPEVAPAFSGRVLPRVLAQLAGDGAALGRFHRLMEQVLIHYEAIGEGATEIDRVRRIADGQRNRLKSVPKQFGALAPDFLGTVARVAVHPSLMRRLWLTIDCETDLPKEWDGKRLAGCLTISLDPIVDSWQKLGFTVSSGTPTRFLYGDYPDCGPVFRPEPFSGVDFDNEDLWVRYQALPPAFYFPTQDDPLLAGVAPDVNPGERTLEDKEPQLTSEGIALRMKFPQDVPVRPADPAHALDERLRGAVKTARRPEIGPSISKLSSDRASLSESLSGKEEHLRKLEAQAVIDIAAFEDANDEFGAADVELQRQMETSMDLRDRARSDVEAARKKLREVDNDLRGRFYWAEDLMRGVAVEVRAQGDGTWHRPCLRTVEICDSSGVPIKGLKPLEEEAAVGSAVTIPAAPVTGTIKSVEIKPAPPQARAADNRNPPREAILEILAAKPTAVIGMNNGTREYFTLRLPVPPPDPPKPPALPEPPPPDESTSIRCLVRPFGAIWDLEPQQNRQPRSPGDWVQLTVFTKETVGKGPPPVAEVYVTPVFEVDPFPAPALFPLQVFSAHNAIRDEDFTIAFRLGTTGFVDEKGKAVDVQAGIKLGDAFKSFLVEGERRSYALGLRGPDHPDVVAVQTVEPPVELRATTRVLCPALPDVVLDPSYVAPHDIVRRLSLPFAEPDSQDWIEVDPAEKLELLRGPVVALEVECAGVVTEGNSASFKIKPAPGVELPIQFSANELVPPVQVKVDAIVRIRAVFEFAKGMIQAKATSVTMLGTKSEDMSEKDVSEEVRMLARQSTLAWRLRISPQSGAAQDAVFDSFTAKPLSKPSLHLLPPWSVPKFTWVEIVGTRAGEDVRARGWPQLPQATMHAREVKEINMGVFTIKAIVGDLVLSDRTVLREVVLSKIKLGQVASGRVQISELHLKSRIWLMVTSNRLEAWALLGEVVTVEDKWESNSVLRRRVHIGTGSSGRCWQLDTDLERTFAEITPGLAPRRVADLEPGDFVLVRGDLYPDSRILLADSYALPHVNAGLRGTMRLEPLSAAGALRLGSQDYLPAAIVTPRGLRRRTWVAGDQAMECEVLVAAVPLVWAKRILAYVPLALRAQREPVESVGEPLHASVTDLIARWTGWSLGAAESGETDATPREPPPERPKWQLRLQPAEPTTPERHQLRLRYERGYQFRCIRVDLAGNNGNDVEYFGCGSRLPEEAASCVRDYRRPSVEQLPMVGHRTSADDRVLSHAVDRNQDAPAQQGSPPSGQPSSNGSPPESPSSQRRVLIVSNPLLPASPVVYRAEEDRWIFPPPCATETFLGTGLLDHLRANGQGKRVLREVLHRGEEHVEHGRFGLVKDGGWLNYFPDPYAADDCFEPARWIVALHNHEEVKRTLTFGSKKRWRKWSPLKLCLAARQVPLFEGGHGQEIVLGLPAGHCARVLIADERRGAVQPETAATLDAVHAVTSPLARPRWVRLQPRPTRAIESTHQSFAAELEYHRATTGAITVQAYWTQYWDEAVPSLFMPAHAEAKVENGAITAIRLTPDAEGKPTKGFGFGSEAVVRFYLPSDSDQPGALPPPEALEAPFLAAPPAASCTKSATVHVVLENESVHGFIVLDGGSGYLKNGCGKLDVLVLRRPPLTQVARAYISRFGPEGEIETVDFLLDEWGQPCRGGYYAVPPLIWLDDPDPNSRGHDVDIEAVLDDDGRIARFRIRSSGLGYSTRTRVYVATHHEVLPEHRVQRPADPIGDEPGRSSWTFSHPLGDALHHRVDYTAHARSFFQDLLADHGTKISWRSRSTPRLEVEVPSAQLPPAPDIAYMIPAFRWQSHRIRVGEWLEETREAAIRIYLHRPWRAEDRLAVVVLPVELNTPRQFVEVEPPKPEPDKLEDPPQLVIPKEMRGYVSRRGFDPIWSLVQWPPLAADDFLAPPGQHVPYARLAEFGPAHHPPVSLVVHEVAWDPIKDLWYADIALRSSAAHSPFLQLALARYQPESLSGFELSHVTLADMISLPGGRRLIVRRSMDGSLTINLTGELEPVAPNQAEDPNADEDDGCNSDPRSVNAHASRLAVVELRRRLPGRSPLIEGPWLHEDPAIDRIHLAPHTNPIHFQGVVHPEALPTPDQMENGYLVVKEFEVFETIAAHASPTQVGSRHRGGHQSVERLVYARSVRFVDLLPCS